MLWRATKFKLKILNFKNHPYWYSQMYISNPYLSYEFQISCPTAYSTSPPRSQLVFQFNSTLNSWFRYILPPVSTVPHPHPLLITVPTISQWMTEARWVATPFSKLLGSISSKSPLTFLFPLHSESLRLYFHNISRI